MDSDQSKLTQQITFDTYARGIRSGIGGQVNYDYYADGSIKDWNGALMISPKIALSRNILLEPVAKLKIGNKLLDRDKIDNNSLAIFNSDSPQLFSYDSTLNVGRKLWYRDLDIGFTINTNIFYVGCSSNKRAKSFRKHIPKYGINKLPNTNSFKCLCRNPIRIKE